MSIDNYHKIIDDYREWELEFVRQFEEKRKYCLDNALIMSIRLIQECWSPAGPNKTNTATAENLLQYHEKNGRIE